LEFDDYPNRYSIQLKYDGSRQFWIKGSLMSERMIDNSRKFSHISAILKGLDATLDGEVYIPFKTVIDLNKKINWGKARYVVFDILEFDGEDLRNKPLRERMKILKSVLDNLNKDRLSSPVHFVLEFPAVDVAWEFILKNKLEGLVIKDLGSSYGNRDIFEESRVKSWIKVKNFKEGKEKIIDFEQGSVKGAFILENGSRISSLKPEVSNIFLSAKDVIPVFAEFIYLNKTEDNAYFQPILKRLVDERGEVLWE